MCGICGVYNAWSEEPIEKRLVDRMIESIRHRGPDEQGSYADGPVGLGSTRLSIIDLGNGQQPMSNETGDVWTVFNGEIWNFRALRAELEAKGHRFRTHCDTETVVHAYEEYGTDFVSRLHGMFGLAVWDIRRKRLLLARDRIGKKPLYYARTSGGVVFASEIKSILYHPEIKREVDPQALADFLSVRYVPAPATLFAGIKKVLPGHWLLVDRDGLREQEYWDFHFGEAEHRSTDDWVRDIRTHVDRAVGERMMADVPVGGMLSGGVDSSIIAGTMSRMTDHPVQTFAVGFDVPGFSELPYARLAAEHFGTEHHELVVRSSDLSEWWPILTWHRDEPVSEPSDLGVYLVSRLARQFVKVVLTGEGGDELFGGYPKYVVDWLARYYHLLPPAVRDGLITPAVNHLPYNMRKVKMAARVLSQPAPDRWVSWFGPFNGPLKYDLLSPAMRQSVDLDAGRVFQSRLDGKRQRDDVSSMLYLDTKIWLPDNLLMKSDKMTMGASLEARVPLLDPHLVEFAARIPTREKIKLFKPKYLLKHAYEDFLPREILTRKKMGFNVPISTWFREDMTHVLNRLLRSERARSRGYLNNDCVARLLQEHMEGRTMHGNQLFILASLELWFRVFIDGAALEYPERSLEHYLDGDRQEMSVA